jgi:aerobic C4-dicarboxylate transport protein
MATREPPTITPSDREDIVSIFRHLKKLYVQVLIGIALGVIVGALWPSAGVQLKPLGDLFIKLIKVVVAPMIFCTVVSGIAAMHDMKAVGRIGAKALIYFEVVSTVALVLGLIVGRFIQPGRGFNVDPATLDPSVGAAYSLDAPKDDGLLAYILHLIPDTFVGAFSSGHLLQVLIIAVLTGIVCTRLGPTGARVASALDLVAQVFFGLIHIIVRIAPIGAFGAMAFTIGQYGVTSLIQLGALVGTFYLTSFLFVVVVLGGIAAWSGFSIFRFLAYIREEILIALGTSSSEPALPGMIEKLQRLGASRQVVGFVIPTGYSFNLDGTNIYLTLSTLFLAQALNIELTIWQELSLLGVAMISSKGAAAVAGGGFITLAATLAVVQDIPIAALALLIGVDRFMSECRGLINLIGNGVATMVVARWDNQLDMEQMNRELRLGPGSAEAAREREEPIPNLAFADDVQPAVGRPRARKRATK